MFATLNPRELSCFSPTHSSISFLMYEFRTKFNYFRLIFFFLHYLFVDLYVAFNVDFFHYYFIVVIFPKYHCLLIQIFFLFFKTFNTMLIVLKREMFRFFFLLSVFYDSYRNLLLCLIRFFLLFDEKTT